MSTQKRYSGYSTSITTPKKKFSVSFTIRKESEPLNRSGVNRVRVDPVTRRLFSAGRDSIIRCWDIDNLNNNKEDCLCSLEHHTDWVNDIVITKDGKTLMSASSDTSLKIWNIDRGTCTSTLKPHKDYVQALSYASYTESIVSAGLDQTLYLWDITSLTQLTASKNTVTTIPLKGQKESTYSVDINQQGTVVVAGSTEKALRVWDTRTYQKQMKLKGHTDNVRSVLLNQDGTECVSGSSDGTVRLWSLGQQRCVETFRMHEQGVWCLAVDDSFRYLFSAGKDKRIFLTDMSEGGQEGVLLFTEEFPVLSLALDSTDNDQSVWVSTTDTSIKKWSACPREYNGEIGTNDGAVVDGVSGDDDPGITDIDELSFAHESPLIVISGDRCIVNCRILNNKRQVLTTDNKGDVTLWDVLHACKESNLGHVDIDVEGERRQEQLYVPHWFSCDIKTGMLSIRLEESDCFSAWVMGDNTNLYTATSDLKLNYGALMLKALFEHWPESHSYKERERLKEASNTDTPLNSELFLSISDEIEDIDTFGLALGLPGNVITKILQEKKETTDRMKEMFKLLVKDSEDTLTLQEFIKSLEAAKMKESAKKMKQELEDIKASSSASKVDTQFFSVPDHTTVVLSESGDCGATLARFHCSEARHSHENNMISSYSPLWITDIVCQNQLPTHPKMSFTLAKYQDNGKQTSSSKPDRLSAQDILTVKKVMDYLYTKLYSEDGKGKQGRKLEAHECMDILCNNQVLNPLLDMRTVKLTVWKSGGDMKLFYKIKDLTEPSDNDEQ